MPKGRHLKPETWTDDKFVTLSPLARLLFMGMWNYACDNGHVEDNVVQLKMRLLPMDVCDVGELINEMVQTGQVKRGQGYLKVVKLVEHQRIDLRYLTLCEWCAHDVHTAFNPSDKKGRPLSAQRAPDVLTSGAQGVHEDDGDGDGDGDGEVTTCASAGAERDAVDRDFAEWYAIYPRKKSKGQAVKAYRAARRKVDADTLLTGLQAALPALTARPAEKVPYPATWLNGEAWDDQPDEDDTATGTVHHLPHVDDIQQPPDDLDATAYREWFIANNGGGA